MPPSISNYTPTSSGEFSAAAPTQTQSRRQCRTLVINQPPVSIPTDRPPIIFMRATLSTQLATRKSKAALGNQPPDGDTEPGLAGTDQAAIGAELATRAFDYVSYFANFDSKPVQQQLPLRLTLTKRHFMVSSFSSSRLLLLMLDARFLLTERNRHPTRI